ncbi:DUF1217 domain-containing protein [Hyphomicrobium sp. LHD-15]|uniref:DUF1217 domain-containing protein n=1 Tax=Hyphomicrobium sp. LHD-15 TaxID=3072142 RepID=UPI00280E4220|nr:DUF1217 domain-containing protein [Hyphomicrobium sp. LHD-15]MDQ8698982.1 DUF1217 domain-containing protein [Hyphomicrobium sp. LHD-15]
MVSTYLSYRMYAADMAKSTARTLSDPQVSREATYYKENIGKITSVDELLKDQRLYAYAMKAHGIEDMTYAKAFMKKVLESDLTDSASFARKLSDQRYVTFARSFNFTPTGGVTAGATMAQDAGDETETVGLYTEQRVRKGTAVATDVDYYESRIGSITTVDQLVSDARLFSFALKSYGIDPDIASVAAIKKVLTSDLSDSSSYANSLNDDRYKNLAAAFSFETDGKIPEDGQAQTATQLFETINAHYEATGNGISPAAAAFKTDMYRSLMADITTVDDFLANSFLRDFAVSAAGLDPVLTSNTTLRSALTSDLSDPDSFVNGLDDEGYRTLASAFNFNAEGGLDDGQLAQTSTQITGLTDRYLSVYDSKAETTETQQTDYYKSVIATIKSVDELLADTRLYNYVLAAFDLNPAEESKSSIKKVLQSDLSNSSSYANSLRDSRYTALAAAFNFGTDGAAQGAIRAQIASSKSDAISRYTAALGSDETAQAQGKIESEYYATKIDAIGTVDDLISDTRLVSYIKKAYGLENRKLTNEELKQALTSDPFDTKSFVNTAPNTDLREIAAAFNFSAEGAAERVSAGQAQDQDDLMRTQDLYIRQTMEETAGEQQSEGVRLALYFERKASSITSAYSILADKALLEVVLTALNLPDSVAQADVDTQAKMLEKRLDFADFKDPKKLDKFLTRFAALYDMANPSTTSSVPSILLGQQQSALIGEDLLTSIQSLKRRL